MKTRDVVIIGGGVIGSAVAYFLAADPQFNGSVTVLEKDPTYAACSTGLSVGGVRQQFSIAENILISRFSLNFLDQAEQLLAVEDQTPQLSFVRGGYLFLATPAGRGILEANYRLQTDLNVDVSLLEPEALRQLFPWLEVTDLAAGALGKNEGWLDPYSLLRAFAAKARSLGVIYKTAEVIGLQRSGPKVTAVELADGQVISCGDVVNAAGPRAWQIAEMVGLELPVRPRKRMVYTIACPEKISGLPLLINPNGVYVRPEGPNYLCGVSPPADQDPDCLDLNPDESLFFERIWPTLAHRIPAFERLKLLSSWAGHYAYNIEDQNAVLGPHPEIDNFYFANGFSGHGLQQSPAVGKALSELIIDGKYQSLDLSGFCFERFASGRLLKERNVV